MTVPLAAGSPRAAHALRFGQELTRAMAARKVGGPRLSAASGCTKASIFNWRHGGNLPRMDTAARLAEVLDWPKLVVIARAGRSAPCRRCGRSFVNEGGSPALYCSVACREVADQLRKPGPAAEFATVVRAELDRKIGERGGLRKEPIASALRVYLGSESRRVARVDKLATHVAAQADAIDAMCAGCEPSGVCLTPECPLRAFSRLPLRKSALRARPVAPDMTYAPETLERRRAATTAANAIRWARPGERERQSAVSAGRWAALTEEERTLRGAHISAGRRKAS